MKIQNFVTSLLKPQEGLSITFLWVENSIFKFNPIFIPPLQGVVLKLPVNSDQNRIFRDRTPTNFRFWVDVYKLIRIHQNPIIFRPAWNWWTINIWKIENWHKKGRELLHICLYLSLSDHDRFYIESHLIRQWNVGIPHRRDCGRCVKEFCREPDNSGFYPRKSKLNP